MWCVLCVCVCVCSASYPCCVFAEVAAFVLYTVGMLNLLEKLHLLYNVLPFLRETEAREGGGERGEHDFTYRLYFCEVFVVLKILI